MRDYKRLTKKEQKKLKIYKKTGKAARKGLKWWGIFVFIAVAFLTGAVGLFMTVDKLSGKTDSENRVAAADSRDVKSDTEITKSELETETQKNEHIAIETENSNEEKPEKPYDFSSWNKSCPKELIVVNKFNPTPEDFSVHTKLCRGKELAAEAAGPVEEMICKAKEDGVNLWICSAYRNFAKQSVLFDQQIEREISKSRSVISREEAEKRASKIVARPGTSEHITGLALDINGVEDDFYLTDAYKWLMNNAHKFGFIERYQKKWTPYTGVIYEPWHFRFVGKENAPKIKEIGLSLEEYIIKNWSETFERN